MLDKNSSLPLYELVKEYILKEIVAGKFPPNSQIPTEYSLMSKLGVGRATVRTALSQLENEGIVEKRHGVGTFVVDRSKSFGFEPFISLSYMLEKIGIKNTNKLVDVKKEEVVDYPLANKWPIGATVHHIQRQRFAENYLIALEDFYINTQDYKNFEDTDLTGSIAHNLLENVDIPISNIEMNINIRQAQGEEENKLLFTKDDNKVIELTRWIYYEGYDKPRNYVKFIVPQSVLQYPFFS